ncbi:MAG: anthranilate synthase component I family protein, partial [Bacteroidetes bacterium]|nr:anthranilate synthase component I family protein [Bacteroidota bacterium]
MRETAEYSIRDSVLFRKQLLLWAGSNENIAFFNSNNYSKKYDSQTAYHTFECLAGIGKMQEIVSKNDNGFSKMKSFHRRYNDWLFGYFTYDMKNFVEKLQSKNPDRLHFPEYHFYRPELVFIIGDRAVRILYYTKYHSKKEITSVFSRICDTDIPVTPMPNVLKVRQRIDRQEYIETVRQLKQHIQRGDIYEMNFCQEFYVPAAQIDPLYTYFNLVDVSPTPFSCYYKLGDKYLLSASPERFLKKNGNKIISQPIKGTVARGGTPDEDLQMKYRLYNDVKERAENVMIVDLVRNDLSQTAKKGTVKVEELFGIYSFMQVHQMISTVVSELEECFHFADCLKKAFPMGSMTGAPKIRAMELIEQYEKTKRGLYSGAVGYITPKGDFDFNVVIRSILFNASESYL